MILQINEQFRITSDGSHNFIVQENRLIKSPKPDVPDRYEWKDIGYHGKLQTACTSLLDDVSLRSEAQSVEELTQELNRLAGDIIKAVKGLGEKNDVVHDRS